MSDFLNQVIIGVELRYWLVDELPYIPATAFMGVDGEVRRKLCHWHDLWETKGGPLNLPLGEFIEGVLNA